MRNQIMSFLIHKEAEWLVSSNQINDLTPANEWHPNFRIEDVELPERALPIHPDFEKPEGEKKKDNSFLNAHLDYFIKHREQEEKKKEFTAAMVSEMMVQNASPEEISNKLMEAVRNKEKRLKKRST